MPAKLFVSERAIATAGLAKYVDGVKPVSGGDV